MDSARLQRLMQRYLEYAPASPVPHHAIESIEARLNTDLPEELKAIAGFFSGDLLGGIGNYRFTSADSKINLVDETLRIRTAIKLPSHLVVLAEPPESLIVLNTNNGTVIWCGGHDVMNLVNGHSLRGPVTEWQNYAEYFEYLLDAEVEERQWSQEDNPE